MNKKDLKEFRKHAQMVFQNPYASLNPKMKIIDILKEPLEINTDYSKNKIVEIIKVKIKLVGLDESCLELYPHEFSGGQRQRIAIARALVLNPEFIIADEPVSALDVSIQAQVINLLKELKEKYNLTIILITHDMSVIQYLADRVAIMYLGEIVESGKTSDIFSSPLHPYTKALLSSVPQIDKKNVYIPLYEDTEHFIILITGGRGSGKSFNAATFIERLTFEQSRDRTFAHRILYCRYTMVSANLSIIPEIQEKIDIDCGSKYFKTTRSDIVNMFSG